MLRPSRVCGRCKPNERTAPKDDRFPVAGGRSPLRVGKFAQPVSGLDHWYLAASSTDGRVVPWSPRTRAGYVHAGVGPASCTCFAGVLGPVRSMPATTRSVQRSKISAINFMASSSRFLARLLDIFDRSCILLNRQTKLTFYRHGTALLSQLNAGAIRNIRIIHDCAQLRQSLNDS